MPGIIDDVDQARAREYALLATLLSRPPDAKFLVRLKELPEDPSALGTAHNALASAAAATTEAATEGEYFDLFVGVGRGELLPYGSFYLSGFLNERPLARLRGDLARLGIARTEHVSEPEDHAAILCEVMSGLIEGHLDGPVDAARTLFEKHIAPWMGRFFVDLEQAKGAKFYRPVGTIGRLFIEIESELFRRFPS
jgi:TorA maturation chaperone TorD